MQRRGKTGSVTLDISVVRESQPDLQRQAKAILFVLGYTGPEKRSVMQGDAVLEQLSRPQLGAEGDTKDQRRANDAASEGQDNDTTYTGSASSN